MSLVIYGNTAEDLGQFNIEFDDNALTDLADSAEGKLEDLPVALHSTNFTIEDSSSSLNVLSIPVPAADISVEVKLFLQLMLKILECTELGDAGHKVVSTVVSAISSYISSDICESISGRYQTQKRSEKFEELHSVVNEARKELLDVYKVLRQKLGSESSECSTEGNDLELEASKELVDMFNQYFHFRKQSSFAGDHCLSRVMYCLLLTCSKYMSKLVEKVRNKEMLFTLIIYLVFSMHLSLFFSLLMFPYTLLQSEHALLGLSMAHLLCSGRESCFQFVNSGGMEQLAKFFSKDGQNSTTIMLLLLGVVERATRYSVGCEGFLGWWPREDENIPSGISEGYSQLLKLILSKPRHDVASLATYLLHRLRFYEVASRYEVLLL